MLDIFVNCKIVTERLTLRPYSLDDIKKLHQIANNPEVYKHIPDADISLEEVEKLVKWSISRNKENTYGNIKKLNLGIVKNGTDKLIGWCGLGPSDLDPQQTEIYYAIDQKYWGQGLASEAAIALSDYAFTTLGAGQITATVAPENIASIKILEKLCMEYLYIIETVPDNCDAFFIGHYYYSLSKEKYNDLRQRTAKE